MLQGLRKNFQGRIQDLYALALSIIDSLPEIDLKIRNLPFSAVAKICDNTK